MPSETDVSRFDEMTPEAYAAMWGCDGSYDRLPRQPGDGALFYNFGSSHQARTVDWLGRFLAAIDRTLLEVLGSPDHFQSYDIEDLGALRGHVHNLVIVAAAAETERDNVPAAAARHVCVHCPIIEQTADGVSCGRCWFALANNVCPRHGEVLVEVERYQLVGKCTVENDMRKRKGQPPLRGNATRK